VKRPRLTTPAIVDGAIAIVDRDGFDALNLSAVAGELGVGPSALYTHISGLDDLQYLVAVTSTGNLVSHIRNAAIGVSGADALTAMGNAYREFSLEHPGQFASTLLPPRSDDDALAQQNEQLIAVFTLVFTAMGIANDESYLAARSTQSALHGFLALEHNSGTTATHGAEYEHLLTTLQRGIIAQRAVD